MLTNADVLSDFPMQTLVKRAADWPTGNRDLAHLVLVPNPPNHAQGDFGLIGERIGLEPPRWTYAGIAAIHPRLVSERPVERFSIVPLLNEAARCGNLSGERYDGRWLDVGTPDRLARARREMDRSSSGQP